MCGICCIITNGNTDANLDVPLEKMLGAIFHRGHSQYRFETHFEPESAFGCNRLPFTSGTEPQPVLSESNRYIVLLNGEIYNFHNSVNSETSDTKAVTDEIERHGLEIVSTFEGIFALIVFDRELKELHLVRDPLGVKPLYYSKTASTVHVCSEVKGLTSSQEISSINEVKPGTILTFTIGRDFGYTEKSYQKKYSYQTQTLSKTEYSNQILSTLETSIREQSKDQKRYGVYLSGGIDSTAVFALLKKQGKDVVPIVIGNEHSTDRAEAIRICKNYGMPPPYKILCPTEEQLFKTVHEVIKTVESFEPNVVRQSCISMLLASGANALGVDAVFCGEGADELFGGYPEMVSEQQFLLLRKKFLRDLHRTQLQRVDRTSMNFTTEVRVPFLSSKMVRLALDPRANGFHISETGDRFGFKTKRALRRAMMNILDESTYSREKVVLSEGAGVKGNHPKYGMFSNIFSNMSDSILVKAQEEFPDWNLNTIEEAFYFDTFASLGYHKLQSSKNRVVANKNHTVTGKSPVQLHPSRALRNR